MNVKMRKRLDEIDNVLVTPNRPLHDIIDKGFLTFKNTYVLKGLMNDEYSSYDISEFQDETGFEVFVNRIHIEDYCEADYFSTSINFLINIIKKWKELYSHTLIGVYSISQDVCPPYTKSHVVRFYCQRAEQVYLPDDLEGFQDEAVLAVSADGISSPGSHFSIS